MYPTTLNTVALIARFFFTQLYFQVELKLLSDRPMESAWSPIQTSHDHPPPSS